MNFKGSVRHPQTEEDREVLDSLPQQTRKTIEDTKNVGMSAITIPLDTIQVHSCFL